MVRPLHNGDGDNGASQDSAHDQNNHFIHYLEIIGQEDKKRCNVCMIMEAHFAMKVLILLSDGGWRTELWRIWFLCLWRIWFLCLGYYPFSSIEVSVDDAEAHCAVPSDTHQ
jgi:hypothetical protein